MTSRKALYITALASAVFSLVISQQSLAGKNFYKWVDKDGVTHYTTTPPPGKKATLVKTYGSKSRAADTNIPAADSKAAANNTKQQAEAKEPPKPQYQKNPDICRQARQNLTTIDSSSRVRIKDDDGQLRYLSVEEKQKRRAEALNAIKINCS